MKKLISIILTIMLALSAFSYGSCFADIKGRVYKDLVSFSEDKTTDYLEELVSHIDHKCATKSGEESYKEYAERMSSSDKTVYCILKSLLFNLNILKQIKCKVKIDDTMRETLTKRFNFYYQNTIKDATEKNEKLTTSDLIEIKKAHQAFPNRFLNVLSWFLEIIDEI